jgi:hypothetical protein
MDLKTMLAAASGKPVRDYSTCDFGREQVPTAISVVVPKKVARSLVAKLRKELPASAVAFMGTTRWLGAEKNTDQVEVVVTAGNGQFDMVRTAKSDAINYGKETEQLIAQLQKWDKAFGIDIWHAETDTIEFDLKGHPPDLAAFAAEVYAFCPDSVEQGVGSVEALAESIDELRSVYLWWD